MKHCVIILSLLLNGCTISFQNISTHGTADDLIDEEQTASPNVDAAVSFLKLP